ncbi:MAG: mercury resistance protein [Nitrospinota bacterium]
MTRRGHLGWFVAAFLLCPCHLPIYAALLAGTALGAAIAERPLLAALALAGAFAACLALGFRARRRLPHT